MHLFLDQVKFIMSIQQCEFHDCTIICILNTHTHSHAHTRTLHTAVCVCSVLLLTGTGILLGGDAGCLPFKKNPGQFGWKILNGKNCLPFTKNSDHGVFTQSASVAPGREN